jgi:excinuclease UvrABC ATPase subunit
MQLPPTTRVMLLAPVNSEPACVLAALARFAPLAAKTQADLDDIFQKIIKSGFFRVRIDGQFHDLEQLPKLDTAVPHDIEVVIDRLVIKEESRSRLAESLQLALKHGEDSVIAVYETERDHWKDLPFCTRYACPQCHINYAELEPRTFSFNSPYGACPQCEGKGCDECKGSRLRAEARNVTFAEKRIYEVCALPIEEILFFFSHKGTKDTKDSSCPLCLCERKKIKHLQSATHKFRKSFYRQMLHFSLRHVIGCQNILRNLFLRTQDTHRRDY